MNIQKKSQFKTLGLPKFRSGNTFLKQLGLCIPGFEKKWYQTLEKPTMA